MKRLIKQIDFTFFQDNANGEFGLTHSDTCDDNYGNGFNAFWGGMGIFHDVFEHSHEHANKYFRGDYAMNIGGEMAAMGAMWYYIDEMGVGNRLNNRSIHSPGSIMRLSTQDMVTEAISEGYCQYGSTLESNVPNQNPTNNGELEYQISEFWKNVKKQSVRCEDENGIEYGNRYKESVTFRKIADLHRYGFRMAEKLVPNNWDNRITLQNFFEFWEDFCKSNNAEEMHNNFKGMTVKLYKDENGFITWKAVLKARDRFSMQDAIINENTRFSIEDYWVIEEENN